MFCSPAIRSLEREFDGELSHRLRHGVVLTAAGEALVQPAQQVLRDDLATAGSMVLSGGRLDIVSQTILSVDPPAHLLGDCHRARPRVYVRVVDPEQEMHVMLPAEHPRPPGDTITSRELATPWASRRGSRWRPGIAR